MANIKLDDLQGGVLAEQVNYELQRVFDNIKDPNVDESKTRQITITLKFKPTKTEGMVEFTPSIKTTLAPPTSEPTMMIVEKDFSSGKVIAKEYNNQIKGQMNMQDISEDIPKEDNGKIVDLLTGK